MESLRSDGIEQKSAKRLGGGVVRNRPAVGMFPYPIPIDLFLKPQKIAPCPAGLGICGSLLVGYLLGLLQDDIPPDNFALPLPAQQSNTALELLPGQGGERSEPPKANTDRNA